MNCINAIVNGLGQRTHLPQHSTTANISSFCTITNQQSTPAYIFNMRSPILKAAIIAASIGFANSAPPSTGRDSGEKSTPSESDDIRSTRVDAIPDTTSNTNAKNSFNSAVETQTEVSTFPSASALGSQANDAEHEATSAEKLKAKLAAQLRLCLRLFHEKGQPEVQHILEECEVRRPNLVELAVLDLIVAGCMAISQFDPHRSIPPKTVDADVDSFIDTLLESILKECRNSMPSKRKQILKWTMIVLESILAAWLVWYLYTDLRVREQSYAEAVDTAAASPSSISGAKTAGQTSKGNPATIVKQSAPPSHTIIKGNQQDIKLRAVEGRLNTQAANGGEGFERSEAETPTGTEEKRLRDIREGKRPMK